MRATPILALLALAAAPAGAAGAAGAAGFTWQDGPVTAEEAARLFDSTCLATLPDFAGADALLDRLGFPSYPAVRARHHEDKAVSAMATRADEETGGAASCVIVVAGVAEPEIEAALAPLVTRRLRDAERNDRPDIALGHAIWQRRAPGRLTEVMLSETDGGTVLAVSVGPDEAGQ